MYDIYLLLKGCNVHVPARSKVHTVEPRLTTTPFLSTTTTLLLRLYSFEPNAKTVSQFIILKTPLRRQRLVLLPESNPTVVAVTGHALRYEFRKKLSKASVLLCRSFVPVDV